MSLPPGLPVSVANLCIELRIIEKIISKNYFAFDVRSLDYNHRSKLLVKIFLKNIFAKRRRF
jgi:hypothetical protein